MKISALSSDGRNDRQWLLGFVVAAALITTLPYFFGYWIENETWQFTGFVFGIEDGQTYLGKMLRGAIGEWLFRTPYTAFQQDGAFIFGFYLILGKLTAPPAQHEQLIALWHLFRVVGCGLAIFATYDFFALFLSETRTRRMGVLLTFFGGGLGWLLILLGQPNWLGSLPLGFYSSEAFGFLGFYGIAHLPWARAFFLWGLRAYLLGGKRENAPEGRFANFRPGIFWLLTGIAQPVTMMVLGVMVGVHLLGLLILSSVRKSPDWSEFWHYLRVAIPSGLIAMPLVIYSMITMFYDPTISNWMAQTRVLPPHFGHYLAAYGMILPFAGWGFYVAVRQKRRFSLFLLLWLGVAPVLLLIPLSFQRRLIEGYWVALVTVTFIGFEGLTASKWKKPYFVLVFTFPTALFLIAGGFLTASRPAAPVFRPRDEIAVFEHLATVTSGSEVVLSAYDTGNALPAWAPVFVVIGHRPESVHYAEVEPRVIAFYQAETSEAERLALIQDFGVDYVFWGPYERQLGNWNPVDAGYLKLEFAQGEFQVYAVKP